MSQSTFPPARTPEDQISSAGGGGGEMCISHPVIQLPGLWCAASAKSSSTPAFEMAPHSLLTFNMPLAIAARRNQSPNQHDMSYFQVDKAVWVRDVSKPASLCSYLRGRCSFKCTSVQNKSIAKTWLHGAKFLGPSFLKGPGSAAF